MKNRFGRKFQRFCKDAKLNLLLSRHEGISRPQGVRRNAFYTSTVDGLNGQPQAPFDFHERKKKHSKGIKWEGGYVPKPLRQLEAR